MLKIVAAAVAVLLVAALVGAAPVEEKVITATGGWRLAPSNANLSMIEALADGDATIKLYSTSRTQPWPFGVYGDSEFSLRANVARPFVVAGDAVDSVYVDLTGGATEVIVTATK